MPANQTETRVEDPASKAREATPEEPQEWFFTFGMAQVGPHGEDVRDRFIKIYGTYRDARAVMVAYFGTEWCAQYGSALDAGTHFFNLRELSLEGFTPLTQEEIAERAERRRRRNYRNYRRYL